MGFILPKDVRKRKRKVEWKERRARACLGCRAAREGEGERVRVVGRAV